MIDRAARLRWRRHFRRSRRQVEDIGEQAEEHLERHLIRRLSNLYHVRRFVLGWITLIGLMITVVIVQARALSPYYQDVVPAPGGTYVEGVTGSFTNANPLYATGGVDAAVSRLVFAGLLKYDSNNRLVGDLAESWSVDQSERRFTVVLRENLYWHDGRPLTSEDVAFTYHLIQNPDARSPLFSSWQGVKIETPDSRTVILTLPSILSAFPHSMTNGIVPKHVLAGVEPSQLRSDLFNTIEPIGAGPFKWDALEVSGQTPAEREERIGLVPHDQYHLGRPKLQRLIIRTFREEDRLRKSLENREITAAAGLGSLPDTLRERPDINQLSVSMTGEVMVFFNNSQEILNDVKVRQALVRAANTKDIIKGLGYPVIPADSPFLRSQFPYDKGLVQLSYSQQDAERLLDEAGWLKGANGVRVKDGKELKFRLYAQNNLDFTYVTQQLQRQWSQVGANVEVVQPSDNDFQSVIALQNYDALLYGISIGVDPDVFAYWHSSQADPRSQTRLNLSQYKSQVADLALEGGRTRIDPGLRAVKYRPFLEAWRNDAPALALYQPRFLYVVRGSLYNFDDQVINTAKDRFNNVHNWMIRQTKINKQ